MTITARAIGVRGDKRNVTTLHSSRLHSDGSIREAEIVRKTTAKTVYARKVTKDNAALFPEGMSAILAASYNRRS